MAEPSELQIDFPSEVQHVDLVHNVCDRISAMVGLDESDTLNLGLAVREATINAIKHGNRMDARKKVRVSFRFDRKEVSVTVHDSGEGFDPAATPDPTLPERIHRPNGRGFLLMRAFVDRVEVDSRKGKGSTVHLVKQVPRGGNGRGESQPAEGDKRRRA